MKRNPLHEARAQVGLMTRNNGYRAWLADIDPAYRAKARALFETIFVADASTYLDMFYVLAYLEKEKRDAKILQEPLDPRY